jgi:hypothetical protein
MLDIDNALGLKEYAGKTCLWLEGCPYRHADFEISVRQNLDDFKLDYQRISPVIIPFRTLVTLNGKTTAYPGLPKIKIGEKALHIFIP